VPPNHSLPPKRWRAGKSQRDPFGISSGPLGGSTEHTSMELPMESNWIEKLFRKLNPNYSPRHEIYNQLLNEYINGETIWLDIGCGRNEHVAEYGQKAKLALGIDRLINPGITDAPFIQANLRNIPLPPDYADLITLRMVVEHIERIPEDFFEINRILKPNGKLIILTTNIMSPVVFLPSLFPSALKNWLILKIFKVSHEDVFPTHHRFNSPRVIKRGICNLRPINIQYLEFVSLDRPLLLFVFGIWYLIVKPSPFRYLRSNILAVFEKVIDNSAAA
jgi:SAM-dependent methyltransferase